MRPRLLDAFCCQGGAAMGYHLAGFEVVGVDIKPQPRFPFEFHHADANEFITAHGHEYDAIHASPPCHFYSHATRAVNHASYPDLIASTREALEATGKPWVIENVEGARNHLRNPVMLCGSMFGLTATDDDGEELRLERHRLFESNVTLWPPFTDYHPSKVAVAGSYDGARKDKHEARHVRHGGYVPSFQVQQKLLGIDWMTERGLHQAIPPAYTAHIGGQLLEHLASREVA